MSYTVLTESQQNFSFISRCELLKRGAYMLQKLKPLKDVTAPHKCMHMNEHILQDEGVSQNVEQRYNSCPNFKYPGTEFGYPTEDYVDWIFYYHRRWDQLDLSFWLM